MGSCARIGVRDFDKGRGVQESESFRGMGLNERDAGGGDEEIYVTLRARLTDHFLRRLEERGGDGQRLVCEGDELAAAGWLRPVHRHDYNFVVPGFGQIRLRVDPRGGGFIAVTFLPLLAG